jgi:hypothetical protein
MAETLTKHSASPAAAWSSAVRTPLVLGLIALLAVQLLLAAVTSGGRTLAPAAADTPLAAFEAARIDAIEIATPDGEQPLVLRRAEGGWIIPALGDFPADTARVDQLLETLAGLQRPLPIATSEAARARFQVADDGFAQRILLKAGKETLASLILGDSPGFRRRYLRPTREDGIYDVRFEIFNLSDQPNDWIAQDQLRLERDRIQRLAAADWAISKDGENWVLEDTPAAEAGELDGELDQAKVRELLTTLANLSYLEVLGNEPPAGFDPDAPLLALEVGLDEDESRRYLIAPHQGPEQPGADEDVIQDSDDTEQDYVLKVAERPAYFLLSAFELGPLLGLDVSNLLKAPEPVQSSDANAETGADAGAPITSEGFAPTTDDSESLPGE